LSIYNGEKQTPEDKDKKKDKSDKTEEREDVEFWEWDICMVFLNPDA